MNYICFIALVMVSVVAAGQTDSTDQSPVLPHNQEIDTVATVDTDSLHQPNKKKSPKKAALLSAVLPGAGQIYNGKYWKLPIVYGALGGMVYLYINNRYWYQQYRSAYINDLDEKNPPSSFQLDGISTTQLREAADANRKNMEYAMIGFALCYTLQIVDATVDAHLFYFDVSDDLSMNWQPNVMMSYQQKPIQGLRLNFTF